MTQVNLLIFVFFRLTVYWGGFSEKFISVGDFRFSYIERGNRNQAQHVFVMLHGFTGDKDIWCHMGGVLPKTLYIVAVDLPGHGYTTRKHHDDHSISVQASKLYQVIRKVVGRLAPKSISPQSTSPHQVD